jgi:hypothetical protein
VDAAALAVGSSSAIFACGAARFGMRVAFIGVCGDDVFGRFMLDELPRREVDDVSHVIVHPAGKTGLSVILDGGAGRIKQKTPFGGFLCPFADLFRTTFPEIRGKWAQKDYLFTNLIEN